MENIDFGSFDITFSNIMFYLGALLFFYFAFISKANDWSTLKGFGRFCVSAWTIASLIKLIRTQTTVIDVIDWTLIMFMASYLVAIIFKAIHKTAVENAEEQLKILEQEEADKELIRQAAKKIIQG
jgi:hypothetical protein